MFIPDHPIDSRSEDALKRTRFAENLAVGLLQWKQKESLIMALNGKWGSGKTSIINLIREYIGDQKEHEKPLVFEFNPWIFSDSGGLTNHFFSELSKSLIKSNRRENKEVANKLRAYSSVLDLKEYVRWTNDFSKLILPLGVLGLSIGQLINLSQGAKSFAATAALVIGFLLIFAELARISFKKVADFMDTVGPEKDLTALEIKSDIKRKLFERSSRLLIIIDDMDRLSSSEILEIFRLIRVNADFPNTTYLLSFDREIVENSVKTSLQVPGRDYLEKIVQVSFDVPLTKESKILEYFFSEIDKILKRMPKKAEEYFNDNDPYWANVFHAGLKCFFSNIRDIKRYASSLNLNTALINRTGALEINPIDFFVVEALRVFAPEFHQFLMSNKDLFLHKESRSSIQEQRENHARSTLDKAFEDAEKITGFDLKDLLSKVFPQLQGLYGNSYYHGGFYVEWSRKLRICTADHFDSYFTMTPGGDEDEISQFEFGRVLDLQDNREKLTEELRRYITNSRLRKLFNKFEYYAEDRESIRPENRLNVVVALFDISDEIPRERAGFGDFGPDIEVLMIVFKILKSDDNKEANTDLLIQAIRDTNGIFGPTHYVRIDLEKEEKNLLAESVFVPERFDEIKEEIGNKVRQFATQRNLLENPRSLSILYFMKELGDEEFFQGILETTKFSSENLILLMRQYITEVSSLGMGDYTSRKSKRFDKGNAFSVIDKSFAISRLTSVKEESGDLYEKYKDDVEFLLKEMDREPGPYEI